MVSAHDLTFLRGDGAFDVISLLPAPGCPERGVPFGMRLHMDRLAATCHSLRLPLPYGLEQLEKWVAAVGAEDGPGSCRIVLTRGQAAKDVPSSCLMLHDSPAQWPAAMRVVSMPAPWHIGYSLAPLETPPKYSEKVDVDAWKTIKWMSYGPNVLMTRLAQERGGDDALLLAGDGRVLDGPNFAVGFVIDGRLRLVAADANRMLPSCTQMLVVQAAAAAGLPLEEGSVHAEEALGASAAFAMSATRHVLPIGSIDGQEMPGHPLVQKLQDAYWSLANADVEATERNVVG